MINWWAKRVFIKIYLILFLLILYKNYLRKLKGSKTKDNLIDVSVNINMIEYWD